MAGASGKRQTTGATRKQGSGAKGRKKTQTRASGGTRRKTGAQQNSFMRTEVAVIASFAISVLLFLSNFNLCGAAGDVCRSVMLGVFGSIGYIAPVLLFAGTCFYVSNRGDLRAALKMGAVLVVLLALCGLAQMIFGGGLVKGQNLFDYYTRSGAAGDGGGLIGGLLVIILCSTLGTIGAYLVLLVLLAIGAVCITEKSLVNFVRRGSGRAYQYAKEDMDRRKVLHEERRAEKQRVREEQRVRGVNLDATVLTNQPLTPGFSSPLPDMPLTGSADYLEEKPEESLKPAVDPADVFCGRIEIPGKEPEEEDPDFVIGEAAASYADAAKPVSTYEGAGTRGGENDSLLKSIYVRRDVRTLEEMELEDEAKEPEMGFQTRGESSCYVDEWQEEPAPFVMSEEPVPFMIPEEPKTVVTASGKVIETDTELVRKTIEQKREARKALPEDELTVNEQIERKAEKEVVVKKEYIAPSLELLKKGQTVAGFSQKEYRDTAVKLQQTLRNFGVGVTVTNISCGPSVTRYELLPEQGVKVSKIVSLSDDIKLNLAAADIRIEAPIPGKAAVGIEVPNKENNTVYLRDLLETEGFKRHPSKVAFAVGKDIAGQVVVTDIAKMPHLLIAGATGSGKSVCINTLIMSVIYKADPEDVKLIMIDPKVVELSVYNGIPHLLIPVVTDPKKASGALHWAVAEMTERYNKFAQYNVRDLKGYNEKIETIKDIEDENKPGKLPQIIIIVDELADLMMVAPGEVEDSICRLAQLARAAGIHLVIATQRPSVNVITGLIKANVPSRIAFSVSSGVDSRTIIDMNGAEKLLGKGDMLFYPAGVQKPQRVQGAFVSDQEVSRVVEFVTNQGMTTTEYSAEVESKISTSAFLDSASGGGERDDYFAQAGRFIIEKDKASIGMLQRMFKIGFNRAARIMDQLSEAGVVGEEEGTKPRKVLMSMEQFEALLEE